MTEVIDIIDSVQVKKHIILEYMKKHKITDIILSYSGAGDCGDIDEVRIIPEGDYSKNLLVIDGSPETLRDAVVLFYEDLLYNSEHSGYWNDSGGSGTMMFSLEESAVDWQHSEYYTETHDSNYSI